ncbi:uncharacterized protein LOC121776826 [Salvia splendens]|uniref:uncharacterized protein LOC121776826 n=1 Tax=Salvia splendens TaxID=180675 RepID=UPI001C272BA4|nr:uncharacterized protein LOC121776826 [Salvia splendens]
MTNMVGGDALAVDDDPEIGSLNAHLSGEPAQAIVVTPDQSGIEIQNNVLAVMPHFYGRRMDNPYTILHEFCKLCGIQKRPVGSSEEDYKYCFPSTKTNNLKKEIHGARQDSDETLSQYWGRYKGLLDACPNNSMVEADVYNTFYERLTLESKDLINSSSGGDFSKLKVSEAKRVLDRLINAKKAYDIPRTTILRRVLTNTTTDTIKERMEARMDKLEKDIIGHYGEKESTCPAGEEGYQNQNPNAQTQGGQESHGNFHPGSGSSSNIPPGASSSQALSKQSKGTEELIRDLLNSQQHLQGNMQANNDVVYRLQDAQHEHKAAMYMLTKQISQMATTLNEIHGHNGYLPATVKMSDRANINKITLDQEDFMLNP